MVWCCCRPWECHRLQARNCRLECAQISRQLALTFARRPTGSTVSVGDVSEFLSIRIIRLLGECSERFVCEDPPPAPPLDPGRVRCAGHGRRRSASVFASPRLTSLRRSPRLVLCRRGTDAQFASAGGGLAVSSSFTFSSFLCSLRRILKVRVDCLQFLHNVIATNEQAVVGNGQR